MGKLKRKKVPYTGPTPEAGMIFAMYKCGCGFKQISNRGAAMYCHSCGEETEEIKEIESVDIQPVVESSTSKVLACEVCNVDNESTIDVDDPHCPQCGGELVQSEDEDAPVIEDEDEELEEEPAAEEGEEPAEEEEPVEEEEEEVEEEPEADVDLDTDADTDVDVDVDVDADESSVEDEMLQEYLTDIPADAKFSAADVHLDLFGDEENPFYNITVAGNPVARIHLADQTNPEELRAIFTKPEYADSIASAIDKCGIHDVLKSVNASLFASQVKSSDLAEEMKTSARNEMEGEFSDRVAGLRDDYAEAIATVIAGINKNFYSDCDNAIKAGIFDRLSLLNIKAPTGMIEEVFAETGPEFFATVLEKAQDFMSKSEEARDEIASAIKESNSMRPKEDADDSIDPYEADDEQALASRMAKGSNVLKMIQGSAISTDERHAMRNRLKLGVA